MTTGNLRETRDGRPRNPTTTTTATHSRNRFPARRRKWRWELPVLGLLACLCGGLSIQQVRWLQTLERVARGERGDTQEPRSSLRRATLGAAESVSESDTWNSEPKPTVTMAPESESESPAVLVFRFPHHSGQGTGNILSGALAAQRLAEEFHRTLCHVGAEPTIASTAQQSSNGNVHASFRRAFEWIDAGQEALCEKILSKANASSTTTIVQNNYDRTSEQSECAMRDLLSNHEDYPIVYYQGNTYPRWPDAAASSSLPTRDYFHERFRPTPALLKILPWQDPPHTVVHLREGDDARDHREGLDDATLAVLARGEFLGGDGPPKVFLVTNNVDWYSVFPEWSHPHWSVVHHSALKRISWGSNTGGGASSNQVDGELQMWADWYTLLKAQRIYHTHSDFSRSASRWNEKIQSWTILGSSTEPEGKGGARLLLQNDRESSSSSGELKRLVDRTKEELWFCGNASPEEKRQVQEKKDQQLLDLVRARRRQRNAFG